MQKDSGATVSDGALSLDLGLSLSASSSLSIPKSGIRAPKGSLVEMDVEEQMAEQAAVLDDKDLGD